MKKKFIVLFVAFYMVSLLVTMPAKIVEYFLPEQGDVKISRLSGSLWSGTAHGVQYQSDLSIKSVSWDVEWMALLTLKVKLALDIDDGRNSLNGKGYVSYGFSGAEVENLVLDIPAKQALSFVKVPIPLQAKGNMSVVIKEMQQGEPHCSVLDGQVQWSGADVESQFGKIYLNTANVQLSCVNGEIIADLDQKSDQLTTDLKVTLKEKGAYQLNGTIAGTNKLDPSIKQSLTWIGPRDANGATILNFQGQL